MFTFRIDPATLIPEKMRSLQPYTTEAVDFSTYTCLNANESPLDFPPELKELFIRELQKLPLNRYPDPTATELRFAFSNRFSVPVSSVVPGNGSDELIFVLLSSFFDKGDNVTVLQPDFSMYKFYGSLCELNIHSLENDGTLTVEQIIEFVRSTNSKGIIFSNPCNPTGSVFTKEDILFLAASLSCLVIVDEAYMDFDDESVITRAPELPNIIVLRTLSKCFGAAGLRIGFAVSNAYLSSKLMSAKSPYNLNAVSQLFGRLILERLPSCASTLVEQREKLEAMLKKVIPGIQITPSHTNFVYFPIDNADLIRKALEAQGVLVRSFNNKYMRISAGTDNNHLVLRAALKEIF